MTLPNKHSRKIVVEGANYRWCLGKRAAQFGLGMGDRVIIQSSDNHGANLVVNLHPFWCDEPSLTPKHVAAWIHESILKGWRPLEPGPPFEVVGTAGGGIEIGKLKPVKLPNDFTIREVQKD
ncbi:hypothetical protein [Planctomicrobium piriforme]|uniref:Uncharacterized protein n=1 Tax=Planctomicrobium piriforme TaxID=1576369 RepID=A0A1I3IEA9_9PLAN|nr:hypothetical protein [Planctomicrobium piriforme]SFI46103.1 hypothetical protein SAMN05421753_10979 [Planctomicrobium piriforme]